MEMNNGAPLVSVIMPAYNAAPFIEEAINSVISQTMTDWELLVIDDCSTDNTREIVEKITTHDSRVKLLVNEKNIGAAGSRNRGLDIFRGQYVGLLDSDDYWRPQMLEKMLAHAVETGADIIYCSYELVNEQGIKVCNDFLVPETTDFKQSIVRSVITCSTVLITANLASKNRFPMNMYHEDIAMWFQILRDGGKACGITDVLAAYRQRKNSRSGDKLISAVRRWPIYRKHLKMPIVDCIVTMVRYGYYGIKKFKKI